MESILNGAFEMTFVTWHEAVLRVGLAIVFGLVLGIDRDMKNKPIDFRAYMIIASSTCVIAMLGQELYADFSQTDGVLSLDLGKIVSGSLTGIGFLGAGAIIHRSDDRVVGTATGASIWASGGIGLALGFGLYTLALINFIAVWAILFLGGLGMKYFAGREDRAERS